MKKFIEIIFVVAAIVTIWAFFRKKCACDNPLAAASPNARNQLFTQFGGSRTSTAGGTVFKEGNAVVVRGEGLPPVTNNSALLVNVPSRAQLHNEHWTKATGYFN